MTVLVGINPGGGPGIYRHPSQSGLERFIDEGRSGSGFVSLIEKQARRCLDFEEEKIEIEIAIDILKVGAETFAFDVQSVLGGRFLKWSQTWRRPQSST